MFGRVSNPASGTALTAAWRMAPSEHDWHRLIPSAVARMAVKNDCQSQGGGAPMTTQEPPGLSGVDLIAAERRRQITEEGYDTAHDLGHADELAIAASIYATPSNARVAEWRGRPGAPMNWPWDPPYWKPTPENRIRELVKAGALIAAAIDAMSRG